MFDDARQIRGDRLGRLARPEIAQRINSDGRHTRLRERCSQFAVNVAPAAVARQHDGHGVVTGRRRKHRQRQICQCIAGRRSRLRESVVDRGGQRLRLPGGGRDAVDGKALGDQIRDMGLPRRICIRRLDDGDRCGKRAGLQAVDPALARSRPGREERRCRAPA